jgi:flavin-dependent dehydrogenase
MMTDRSPGGNVERLDVAILGGGMAGSLLARQLLRSVPGLRVGLFERSRERGYRVGESTVELGSNYLVRRLGLSRYLYEHHLPKNGLRYFFDDSERSLPLAEMTEIGSWNLPFHPAFQIDRARFDGDLLDMVEKAGADVRLGARVHGLELGERGASHCFRVDEDGREQAFEARWLVDATGRSSLVARAKGLRVKDVGHRVGSTWGRFEGVADVDDMGPEDFRARVRHTSRGISTMHFCYPGYWVWFIPIKNGITSVGVVGAPPREARLRTPEGFRSFLDEHTAIRELMQCASTVDVQSYAQLGYGTGRFLSADRWAMTGEAAAFADPLYSPGADFIALENDFICDAIQREAGGEGEAEVAERIELYDRFLEFRFEAAMLLYRGQYGLLGSAELMRLKWDLDLGLYYNLWVSSYMQDQHLDRSWLRRELRQKRFVLQAMKNFSDLFRKAETRLREQGSYWRANCGQFSYGLEHIDFVEEVGMPRTRRQVLEKTGEIFNSVYLRTLEVLEKTENGAPARPLPLTSFMVDRPLA